MDQSEKNASQLLKEKGWGIYPPNQYLSDMEPAFLKIWESVSDYTMISPERGYAFFKAVEFVTRQQLPGDIVECGVWKGGACMLAAHALQHLGDSARKIRLYDTFTGMTEPCGEDQIAFTGQPVSERWEPEWWAVSQEEVYQNVLSTGISSERIELIKGDVCQTLKTNVPEKIAILRLDTDWYESTRVELDILYPQLSQGGFLIIDDYGHFTGARKAVDEYFSDKSIFLSRSDYTGRIGRKF